MGRNRPGSKAKAGRPTDGLLTAIKTGPTLGSSQIQGLTFAYDGLGNLTKRTTVGQGGDLAEAFTYNRLTTGGMGYAANGNITAKGAVDGTVLSGYTYSPTKPHAVTGVTATLNGVATTYTFAYDANGNLTSRTGGGQTWSTKWAGFDKPRWLIDATTGKGDEFTYNANRSRVVHLSIDGVNGTGTAATPKHYSRKKVYGLGPQLEADYVPTASFNPSVPQSPSGWSLQKIRIYVPGPEGNVGTMELAPEPGQSIATVESALVYHYDHLGSIERLTPYGSASTTYVLDDAGKQSRYSYDAWGQRRDPNDWSGKPTATADGGSDDATPRGFTGHEMLDDLGLVHMNGRIYDPLLGRFLSADTIVDGAADLQGYNRYSYVQSRPPTMVDQSGHFSASYAGQAQANRLDILFRHHGPVKGHEIAMQANKAEAIGGIAGGAIVAAGGYVATVGLGTASLELGREVLDEATDQVFERTTEIPAPVTSIIDTVAQASVPAVRSSDCGAARQSSDCPLRINSALRAPPALPTLSRPHYRLQHADRRRNRARHRETPCERAVGNRELAGGEPAKQGDPRHTRRDRRRNPFAGSRSNRAGRRGASEDLEMDHHKHIVMTP